MSVILDKVLGPRERATGTVTQSTWSIMQSDLKFKPRRKADSPTHVEVYLQEQVLIVFTNQEPVLVTHISSGTGEKWCEEVKIDPGEEGNKTTEQIKQGICGQAVTPGGIFYFYNRRTGMRETKLGSLYNPVYFNYNIAVHGAILVPLKPASHGCIRIPMSVARYFPALVTTPNAITVARIANAISAGRQRSRTDSLTGIFIEFYFRTNLLSSVSPRLA